MKDDLIYQIYFETINPSALNDQFANFVISLDSNFAKRCLQAKINPKAKEKIQELGFGYTRNFSVEHSNPYHFNGDSLLVDQITVKGENCWLSTKNDAINSLEKEDLNLKVIKYIAHNVDTPYQQGALLTLFSQWVKFVPHLGIKPL